MGCLMSSGLDGLVGVKRRPRLSIEDIHRRWNDENHQQAGLKPYRLQHPQPIAKEASENGQADVVPTLVEQLSGVVEHMGKRGKWVNSNGEMAEDEPINVSLFNLVMQGDLKVYPSTDLGDGPCRLEETSMNSLLRKTDKYFVDRGELGRLLLKSGQVLPKFWYGSEDVNIFGDQLSRNSEALTDMKVQVSELLEENKFLKAQLSDAMPFMNPDHPCYTQELEAAVALWLELYSDKEEGAILCKGPARESWLKNNRPEAVCQANGSISQTALERVSMVTNPNKKGGRPPTKV